MKTSSSSSARTRFVTWSGPSTFRRLRRRCWAPRPTIPPPSRSGRCSDVDHRDLVLVGELPVRLCRQQVGQRSVLVLHHVTRTVLVQDLLPVRALVVYVGAL